MRRPGIKFAVAAAVVVACLMGISLWRQTGAGLALADVLARMEQVRVYRLQMTTSFQMEGGESRPMAEATMLVSQSLGQRVTIQLDNPLTGQSMLQEIYISLPGRTITTLMPDQKQFSKVELDDASIERWRRESDPKRIVEQVLQCEHTPLGRSVIDGIEVEGFRTTDPSCLGETSTTGAEITIWADAESRLPVRIEIDKGEQGKGQMHVAAHDFQWDISAGAAEFEPVIPADYTPGRPMMQIGPKQ